MIPDVAPISWSELIGVSAKSVCTVAACAGVGAYGRRMGVFTKEAESHLGKLITSIFLPSLIFQKLISTTNLSTIISLWPLAFMCIATVAYGLVFGYVLGKKLPVDMRNLVMVATAFPNSFAVPLTLMLALGPRSEFLTADDAQSDLADKVNSYFLMSYSLWVLARWSIGHPLLQGVQSCAAWRAKVLNPPVIACLLGATIGAVFSATSASTQETIAGSPLLQPFGTALEYAGRCAVPCTLMTLGANLSEAVKDVLSRPPVQDPLLGQDKPMGDAPVTTPLQPLLEQDGSTPKSMPLWGYFLVLLLRQIIGPAYGALIALGFLRHMCGVTQPLVLMVGMLQTAGPPMINLAVMVGLKDTADGKSGKKETATLLLLTYAFSLLSWTGAIALFLQLLRTAP